MIRCLFPASEANGASEEFATTAMKYIGYAGALPFRLRESTLEVLLITALTTRRWIVPKGHWDLRLNSW